MSDKVNIFEQASRLKLRFTTPVGELSAEQLWDLPLTGTRSLDAVAVSLNDQLNKSEVKSFVSSTSTADKLVQLRFDIAKYIIEVRKEEKQAAADKAENASKRKLLKEAIAAKQNEQLLSGDLAALEKKLAELDD